MVQPLLVAVELVPAGSPAARSVLATSDRARTLKEVTVIADGSVWTGEHVWVMCLWATRSYRSLADRLSRPAWLPLARAAAFTAAGIRTLSRTSAGGDYIDGATGLTGSPGGSAGYPDGCDSASRPLPQG